MDEVTSAVSQSAVDQDVLAFQLKLIGPDGTSRAIPVSEVVGSLELGPGERWSYQWLDEALQLERQTGQASIRLGEAEFSRLKLPLRRRAELLQHNLWLVDPRDPLVGLLEGCSGEYQGKVWSLGYQTYRVGRRGSARHNDIELNHPTISRLQASLFPGDDAEFWLEAESGTSPALVNSQLVALQQRVRLGHGDLLQLGELTFRYRSVVADRQVNYFPTDGSLPSSVGPYRVVGQLGSGGMGVVYEGVDSQGQPVALKIPLPHLLKDADFIRRFNREMKLGTDLQHPRVTRILHFEPAGGEAYPYLVMEKLQGSTLEKVPLPLDIPQALQWCHELLEALEYFHQQGVIHRDLKPANLYLTPIGIKVADLGIAHFSGTVGARATQTGTILGTPVYLDPAMLRGRTADSRSDLYSAGLLLYEWLVGSLPYPADPLQIFRIKLSDDLPPMTDSNPGLPEALCQFVDKLIHPEPEARFQSAAQALAALRILRSELAQ